MAKILTKLAMMLFLVAVMLGLFLAFAPWKAVLDKKITAALEARGYKNVNMSIEGLGLKGVVLKDITLGGDTPLILNRAALDYSLQGLWHKKLGGLALNGLFIQLIKEVNQGWVIVGLENVLTGPAEKKSNRVLPVSIQQISSIPFEHIKAEDSTLTIKTPSWHANLPLKLELKKTPVPQIILSSSAATLQKGGMDIAIGTINVHATLSEQGKKWEGNWNAENITLMGTPTPVPVLSGAGSIVAEENRIVTKGALRSEDNAYRLAFTYVQAINDSVQSDLLIESAAMPWKEGQLATRHVKVPLSGKQAITIPLQVDNVSIDELIGTLTGQRVSATGTVSGIVPVTVGTNGSLTFHGGNLKAAGPGMIIMPPEAIPGDNAQIALVRDILKDLRYTKLSIDMDSDEKKNLSILLALEGSNPAVYNGRAVKLNVKLTGDLLDFIKQNLMFLYDPKSLLEAGNNAEN